MIVLNNYENYKYQIQLSFIYMILTEGKDDCIFPLLELQHTTMIIMKRCKTLRALRRISLAIKF